jgi:hypothetical protein
MEEAMTDTEHYLGAIRLRLERLYEVYPNDHILREQISDEVDWIDAQLNATDNQAALVNLVQTLIDNDPDAPIADNGMTVLDGWREQARRVLALQRSPQETAND